MFLIFTVIVIGLSGIAAEVLILRELLVSFFGNELTLGIILANWLALEALGVFIIGKFIEKVKNKIAVFISLELIFALTLPLAVYFARTFKNILGIPFGEGIGLAAIFGGSFFVILPLGFCHGALFSAACEIYSNLDRESPAVIGRVYTFEIIGTIIGGLILTYLFIPFFDSFQIVFIVSLINLVICLFFLRIIANRQLRLSVLFLIIFSLIPFLVVSPGYLERLSITKQFNLGRVLDCRNSVYGNVVVTESELQHTFFYNGIPIITTPYPDITFAEEFGNLPLLFHPNPKDILVISGGAGGLIYEILKHPITKIDYAELDPLIIEMLNKYPSDLTLKELADPRVKVINADGRFFLKHTDNKYDVVMLGISKPTDLSINRLFTEEFFRMIRKRLRTDGILSIWLPGSLTYLSSTVRDVNFSVINAIKKSYAHQRIIPGDYNLVFASDSAKILDVTPKLLRQRIASDQIKTRLLKESYLDYRMDKRWLDWFRQSTLNATVKINKDFSPFALFLMLVLWNQQFSPRCSYIFDALSNLNLPVIFGIIVLIAAGLLCFIFLSSKSALEGFPRIRKFAISYAIATTGFFGMLINLVLIFAFQVFYGYLYNKIGLLLAIFMAGIASGSALMTKNMALRNYSLRLLIRIEIWIIAFSYILALILGRWNENPNYTLLIFIFMFLICGFLIGLEFPLASKLFFKEKAKIGITSGLLYFSDLLGGWLAGILGGIIFLPLLGLFNTCILIIPLKLLSLSLLALTNYKPALR
jgi:spermidine synthase